MSGSGAPIERPASTPAGVRVGRYTLYAEIAKGGMASVHFGRLQGDGGFSRTVAIKRLFSHLARDPQIVAAFFDEARVSSRLHHPNVVATLDVVAADGDAYLVLDYVHGPSLGYLLKRTRDLGRTVDPRVAARVLVDALHGLHAAHVAKDELGRPLRVVHRDVSPQNLLVGADGATRVVDFGVAKALGQAHVTNHGEVKGKLAYMAPEQLRGGKDVDCRSDVFAAGAILWELLTGERLFAGEADLDVARGVVSGPILPPSVRRPSVTAALDAVAMRALERDRDRRFATASDFALALERAMPDGPASLPDVAAWVDSLAGARLRRREAYLAAVEAGVAPDADDARGRDEDPAPTPSVETAPPRRDEATRVDGQIARAAPSVDPARDEAPTSSGFRLTAAAAVARGDETVTARLGSPRSIAPAAPAAPAREHAFAVGLAVLALIVAVAASLAWLRAGAPSAVRPAGTPAPEPPAPVTATPAPTVAPAPTLAPTPPAASGSVASEPTSAVAPPPEAATASPRSPAPGASARGTSPKSRPAPRPASTARGGNIPVPDDYGF